MNFVNPDPMSFVGHEASTANKKGESASDRLERLQGRLAFLNAVAPQCDTPVLQERLQDARDALQKAIANPVQQEK